MPGIFRGQPRTKARHPCCRPRSRTDDAPPNIPFYLEILRHAFDRSSPNEEGSITFTEEEIIYLACDPDFAAFYPDQAAQMRKILQGDG